MRRLLPFALAGALALVLAALIASAVGAGPGGDEGEKGSGDNERAALPLQSPVAKRAGAAATGYLQGGNVLAVVRESDNGAFYGVEVQQPSGQLVEVHLNKAYRVLGIDRAEGGEQDEGGD